MYYWLTKPGIIYGNAITAAAGFFLASKGQLNLGLFLAMLVGIALVMASSCVFNNYIDRGIDSKMARTKRRALVSGAISGRNALAYATALGFIGFALLICCTNLLTAFVALAGFVFYIVLYGYTKRHSVHGTLVGSVSGAVPPVVGYVSVTGKFDLGALLLFVILVAWQMPHFYAIAIYRLQDYAAAHIPVLPIKKGLPATKIQMLCYIVGFMILTASLTTFGYVGHSYLVVMTAVGLLWLRLAVQGFKASDDTLWARRLFRFSLLVLLVFSLMISIDVFLP